MSCKSAFGSRTPRFATKGVHPDWKLPGDYLQIYYEPEVHADRKTEFYNVQTGPFTEDHARKLRDSPGWKKGFDLSKEMAIPHLLYKPQFEKNKEIEARFGPGMYKHTDFIQEMNKKPSSKLALYDRPESRRTPKNDTPGPGEYTPKKRATTVKSVNGTYELSPTSFRRNEINLLDHPSQPSDRSSSFNRETNLFPGAFHKNLSLKKFCQSKSRNAALTISYEVQSFTDVLQKENKGKFNMNKYQYNPSRLARHLPPSDNPAPSDYSPHSSSTTTDKTPAGKRAPFLTSAPRERKNYRMPCEGWTDINRFSRYQSKKVLGPKVEPKQPRFVHPTAGLSNLCRRPESGY
ncbi:Oidioi.mRNA.OKI2018_I69.chr2.g6036.t1.cds [Oikopleura dioica]|uniref:Oidioi.mRNA.OKI2018_I69.chr2.g6036.t1.cds n=1 Tax=Oikopleura dioica TaxID=34765 RepID=A0ABN7T3Z8_OIKDI|nr:Oidioi.mRNA.OKI2018_I69.chr2.g6036.t1.cds [Oikopleura dioica]